MSNFGKEKETIVLTIDREATYQHVMNITNHLGRNFETENGEVYNHVAVTDDDYESLDVYLKNAVEELATELRRYVTQVKDYSVTLELPHGKGDELGTMAQTGATLFAAYYVTAAWTLTTELQEKSGALSDMAQGELDNIKTAISKRELGIVDYVNIAEETTKIKTDDAGANYSNQSAETGEVNTRAETSYAAQESEKELTKGTSSTNYSNQSTETGEVNGKPTPTYSAQGNETSDVSQKIDTNYAVSEKENAEVNNGKGTTYSQSKEEGESVSSRQKNNYSIREEESELTKTRTNTVYSQGKEENESVGGKNGNGNYAAREEEDEIIMRCEDKLRLI